MGMLLLLGVLAISAVCGAVGAGIAEGRTLGLGVAGVVLSYLLMWATPLPGIIAITVNNTTVYPVWANGLSLLLGIAARPVLAARKRRAPTPEEREAEIRRRARERARKYR